MSMNTVRAPVSAIASAVLIQVKGLAKGVQEFLRHTPDSIRSHRIPDRDRELVIAGPGQSVGLLQGTFEAFCDFDQERVAGRVAQTVIYQFEAINVDTEQTQTDVFLPGLIECVLQSLL